MKYEVFCNDCPARYRVEFDDPPSFCQKCGSSNIMVHGVPHTRGSARVTAEAKMKEMDEVILKIDKAYEDFLVYSTVYRDHLHRLRYYKNRKVITEDEFAKYYNMRDHAKRVKMKEKNNELLERKVSE